MQVTIKNDIQLKQAKEDLQLLRKAWRKILEGGQEYEMGTNRMKRASLSEISQEISAYEVAIDSYEKHKSTGVVTKMVIPID